MDEEGGQLEEEKVAENVTDWVEAKRRPKGRMVVEWRQEEDWKSCPTVQIFVKVNGSKTLPLEVSLSDKVGDIVKRIPSSVCCSKRDVYVPCEGRVIRRGDELKCCGVRDGSTVQVTSRMLGGRRRKEQAGEETSRDPKESRAAVRGRTEERRRPSDSGVRQGGNALIDGGRRGMSEGHRKNVGRKWR